MTLRISKLNATGFTATQVEVVEGDQTYVDSAFEAFDIFSVDLKFEGAYEDYVDPGAPPAEPTYTYANAINVTSSFNWASIGITYSKPNAYTVRLVGPAVNVFVDQFYKFKLTNYTEQILPANTTQPFFGLTQYQMPNPTYTMKTYPFTVTIPKAIVTTGAGQPSYESAPYYDINGNLILSKVSIEPVDMKQWFYWRYQVAVTNIAAINARGLK
jgi:hypothetical protein